MGEEPDPASMVTFSVSVPSAKKTSSHTTAGEDSAAPFSRRNRSSTRSISQM